MEERKGEVKVYPFASDTGSFPVLKCEGCGAINRFYAKKCSVCGEIVNNISLIPETFIKVIPLKEQVSDVAMFWWQNILCKLDITAGGEITLRWYFPLQSDESLLEGSLEIVRVDKYYGFTLFGINDIFLGIWGNERFIIYELPAIIEGRPEKIVEFKNVISVSLTNPGRTYKSVHIITRTDRVRIMDDVLGKFVYVETGDDKNIIINDIWKKSRGKVWEGSFEIYTPEDGEIPVLTPFGTFVRSFEGVKVLGKLNTLYRLNIQKFPVPQDKEQVYDPDRNEIVEVDYRREVVNIKGVRYNLDLELEESFEGTVINSQGNLVAVLTTKKLIIRRE